MSDRAHSSGLYPILQDSLAGRFDLAGSIAILAPEVVRITAEFDFDRCLMLRRYLDLCRIQADGIAPEIDAITEDLRLGLEERFSRDPSDHNLLFILALADRDRGERARALRRLRKVACSGYRASAAARSVLAEMTRERGVVMTAQETGTPAGVPFYVLVSDTPDAAGCRRVGVLAAWAAITGHDLRLVSRVSDWSRTDCPVTDATADDFLKALCNGEMAGVDRAVILSSPALLGGEMARYGDVLVLDMREGGDPLRARANKHALARLGPNDPPPFDARVSLISSVFRATDYIEGFLFNISGLEDYSTFCQHLFLFSGLSEAERKPLFAHFDQVANAAFIWHRSDPGLYECWNIGVRLAHTEYVSNANVDDLRHPRQAKALVRALDTTPGAAIAAAALVPFEEYQPDYRVISTENPWYAHQAGIFHLSDLGKLKDSDGRTGIEPHCMPHCMPLWRRDSHEACGFFDEATFGPFADWAYWMEVLRHGACGVLIPEPLSYYFVNPGSHNRRGDKLQAFHRAVEDAFLVDFRADLEQRKPVRAAARARVRGTYARKLNLLGRAQGFGEHRNAFNRLIMALEPLDVGPQGIDFLPFIERTFVWGDDPGEAASDAPRPRERDWVGVLHVPFGAPDWFMPQVSPEQVFKTAMWEKSLPTCRGVISLSEDTARDFGARYRDIPSLAVSHPTDLRAPRFEPERYCAQPRLVQAGDWLRKLQAIFRIQAPGHEKIMLLKNGTYARLEKDIGQFGDKRNESVDLRYMVPNEEYDDLLASSVVLCLLYGTAANNLVIECMARATPILVNPLPAIIEYIGPDYPFYAEDVAQADRLLADKGAVRAAHHYLEERTPKAGIGYDDFLRNVGGSQFYQEL